MTTDTESKEIVARESNSEVSLPWDIIYIVMEQTSNIDMLINWACVSRKANIFAEKLLWSSVTLAVQDCQNLPKQSPVETDILARPKGIEAYEGLEFHLLFNELHPEPREPEMTEQILDFLEEMVYSDDTDTNQDDYAESAEGGTAEEGEEFKAKRQLLEMAAIEARRIFSEALPGAVGNGDLREGFIPYGTAHDYGIHKMEFRHKASKEEWLPIDAVHYLPNMRPLDLIRSPLRGRERRRAGCVTSLAITEKSHSGVHIPPKQGYMVLKQSVEHELLVCGAYNNLRRLKIVGNLRQKGWDAVMRLPSLEELWLFRAFDEIMLDGIERGDIPLNFQGLGKLISFHIGAINRDETDGLGRSIAESDKLRRFVLGHANMPRCRHGAHYGGVAELSPLGMLFKGLIEGGGFPASLEDFRLECILDQDIPMRMPAMLGYRNKGITEGPSFAQCLVGSLSRCTKLANLRLDVRGPRVVGPLLEMMSSSFRLPSVKTLAIRMQLKLNDHDGKPDRKYLVPLLRSAIALHKNINSLSIINPRIRAVHYLGPNLPGFRAKHIVSTCIKWNARFDAMCLAYYLDNDKPELRHWIRTLKHIAFTSEWCACGRSYHRVHNTTFTRMFSKGISQLDLPELRVAYIHLQREGIGYLEAEYRIDRFFFEGSQGDIRTRDARLGIALGSRNRSTSAEAQARAVALGNENVRIVAVGQHRFWIQRRKLDMSKRYNEDSSRVHVWPLREALGDATMKGDVMNWITDEDWEFLQRAEMDGNEIRFVRKEGYFDDGEILDTKPYGWHACRCELCYVGPRPGVPNGCGCCEEDWRSRADA